MLPKRLKSKKTLKFSNFKLKCDTYFMNNDFEPIKQIF